MLYDSSKISHQKATVLENILSKSKLIMFDLEKSYKLCY